MTKKSVKRVRIFAGPNGSGKTTIIRAIRKAKKIPFGVYINADDIERELNNKKRISISPYQVSILAPEQFYQFCNLHGITKKKRLPDFRTVLKANRKSLVLLAKNIDSYVAAVLADFLRESLLASDVSFSFETVMSDKRKIQIAQKARNKDCRVYLYYVATVDPEINIERVNQRVHLGGHRVSPELIKKRYERSLGLLFEMVRLTDRAYLFDNSGSKYELIAEITNGKQVRINGKGNDIPNWFYKYVYQKANLK